MCIKYYDKNKEKIIEYRKHYRKENKCNFDCFNCIYEDCIL